MAVVLKTKPKAVAQPKFATVASDELLSDMADLIDQLGAMEAEVEEAKKLIKQWDAKVKKLREAYNAVGDAEDVLIERGAMFEAELGPRSKSRSVSDIQRVYELMGHDTFLKLASVKLTDIDKYLTPDESAEVLEHSQDGNRPITLRRRKET